MVRGKMLQVKEPTLLERILAKDAIVGVCGLGYVGLPLALTFGEKGFAVLGFDIDARKVDAISKGESYIKHIPGERVAKATKAEKPFAATMDFRKAAQADVPPSAAQRPTMRPARLALSGWGRAAGRRRWTLVTVIVLTPSH